MNKNTKNILFLILGLVVFNFINQSFYKRFDLTADNRYSLSKTTNSILSKIDRTRVDGAEGKTFQNTKDISFIH